MLKRQLSLKKYETNEYLVLLYRFSLPHGVLFDLPDFIFSIQHRLISQSHFFFVPDNDERRTNV